MAQFHHFFNLPKELRDEIWDMAIRDDGAAAHFFTIYDNYEDPDPDSVVHPAMKVHATRDPDVSDFFVGFAAPRPRGSDRLSWTEGNTSTYMTDSGLWTACHESRARILRHFKPYETSPQLTQYMKVDGSMVMSICDKPTASIHMPFTRDNGERQYLTIRPSTDLLCLQLPKDSNISWGKSRYHWQQIQHFPLFRWRLHTQYLWELSCLLNVAVEYDPAWEVSDRRNDLGPFAGVRDGFSRVNEINRLETFWFIDYRLTRKYKPDSRERQTFRAGKLVFIEVDAIDYEWCCCPMGGCLDECRRDSGRLIKHGAHALIDRVELYNEMEANRRTHYINPWDVHRGADMRVLACVDLESEGELPTREEWHAMHD